MDGLWFFHLVDLIFGLVFAVPLLCLARNVDGMLGKRGVFRTGCGLATLLVLVPSCGFFWTSVPAHLWLLGLSNALFLIVWLLLGVYIVDIVIGARGWVFTIGLLLAIPLLLVPDWHNTSGPSLRAASTIGRRPHIPVLDYVLYDDESSSWAWSRAHRRQLDEDFSSGEYRNLPWIDGFGDPKLTRLIIAAREQWQGSEKWIPVAREGDLPTNARTDLVLFTHAPITDGVLAGLTLQEVYRERHPGGVVVVYRDPSWQYRLGSMVNANFAVWLSSDKGLEALEEAYWMTIVIALWLIARTIVSIKRAHDFRVPHKRYPLLADALAFFFVQRKRTADFLTEVRKILERRFRFDPVAARREYYRFVFENLPMLIWGGVAVSLLAKDEPSPRLTPF